MRLYIASAALLLAGLGVLAAAAPSLKPSVGVATPPEPNTSTPAEAEETANGVWACVDGKPSSLIVRIPSSGVWRITMPKENPCPSKKPDDKPKAPT